MPRKNPKNPAVLEHDRVKREEYHAKNSRWINYYGRWKRKQSAELLKRQIFRTLGDRCGRCGFSDSRALQIDHINGGGKTEAKNWWYRNKEAYYRKVLTEPQNYQILCANCNWIKRHDLHVFDREFVSWDELKLMKPEDREIFLRNFKPLNSPANIGNLRIATPKGVNERG